MAVLGVLVVGDVRRGGEVAVIDELGPVGGAGEGDILSRTVAAAPDADTAVTKAAFDLLRPEGPAFVPKLAGGAELEADIRVDHGRERARVAIGERPHHRFRFM